MDIVANELPYDLSTNATLFMADHLSFAVARAQKGVRIAMPLAYEVRETYPKEYKAAQFIVMRLEKELGERLPKDEIASIAMNLVNARVVEAVKATAEPSPERAAQVRPLAGVFDGLAPLADDWRQLIAFTARYYQRALAGRQLHLDAAGELALGPVLRQAVLRRQALEMEVGVLGAIVRAEAARSARSGCPAGERARSAGLHPCGLQDRGQPRGLALQPGRCRVRQRHRDDRTGQRDDGHHHQQLQQREAALAAALAGTAHCQEPMSASLPSPPAWPSAP